MEDFKFLTEAYMGKSKLMLECEDLLEVIIDKTRRTLRCNINKLPESKKLEDLLCEQFGFRGISLYWTDTPILGPAYTICGLNFIQTITKSEHDFLQDDYKKGYYDYNHSKYVVITLSAHMINTYKDLTAEHIMSLILHEIGHNFSTSPFNIIKSLTYYQVTVLGIAAMEIASSNTSKKIIDKITSIPSELINLIPAVKVIWYKIQRLFNILSDILGPINNLSAVGSLFMIPIDLLFILRNVSQKVLELESDGIASSYGYSKPLAEALDIFGTHGKSGYKPDTKNAFINVVLDLNNIVVTLYTDVFGTHPSNIVRLGDQITKLEASLKRGEFEPNLEKELQSQINDLKYMIENYDKVMKHDNFHMSAVINMMYAKQFLN